MHGLASGDFWKDTKRLLGFLNRGRKKVQDHVRKKGILKKLWKEMNR